MSDFELTKTLPPYIFAKIDQLKLDAKNKGLDIIDFGMGNPDLAPPQNVIDYLTKLTANPKLYGYSVSGGINDLKQSFCKYYAKRFNVNLDPKDEALVTIGAKEGLTSLATAISNQNNHIIVPNPSYPIHTFAFIIAKSKVVTIDNLNSADFLQSFKDHIENSPQKPVAIIVNFPCNPTTDIVNLEFYQELVDFCLYHKIYIISDIAYCEIYFDENDKPPSILQVKRAKEIAVEFSSISKTYSMAGCRVGFAAGNKDLIKALKTIKSYLDYGSFIPLQMAAIEAMGEQSDQYLQEIRQIYQQRAVFLRDQLAQKLNWEVKMPKATMFLWAKIPNQFQHINSFDFCYKLIQECGVALSPGSSFGSQGEGYVRFSLIHEKEKTIEAINRMVTFFQV